MAILRDNLSLKLFALFLAMLLEVYFYSPDNSVTEKLLASVELRNVPNNLMVISPVGGVRNVSIALTVRGPAPVVQQLKRENLRYIIDLPPGITDSYLEYVKPEQLTLGSSGVRVIDFSPPILDLKFDTVIRKELLVIVPQRGEPADGYRLKKLNIRPVSVIARGPESELSGVGVVETQPLEINEIREPRQAEVALVPPGAHTLLDVNVVHVDVLVSPVVAERTFDGLPIDVKSEKGGGATVSPATATVVVSGPTADLNQLDAAKIKISVDAASAGEGSHMLPLTATLPEGFEVESVSPEAAEVVVIKDKSGKSNSRAGAEGNG